MEEKSMHTRTIEDESGVCACQIQKYIQHNKIQVCMYNQQDSGAKKFGLCMYNQLDSKHIQRNNLK
jgi:hypothetical protein